MSFANMWTVLTAEQEKEIIQEFFLDILLLAITITVLELIIQYDPKGCGIPLREWLIGFACLYFSRSSF